MRDVPVLNPPENVSSVSEEFIILEDISAFLKVLEIKSTFTIFYSSLIHHFPLHNQSYKNADKLVDLLFADHVSPCRISADFNDDNQHIDSTDGNDSVCFCISIP